MSTIWICSSIYFNKLNSTVWIYSSMDIIDFITIDHKNIVLLCVAEQRVSPSLDKGDYENHFGTSIGQIGQVNLSQTDF